MARRKTYTIVDTVRFGGEVFVGTYDFSIRGETEMDSKRG